MNEHEEELPTPSHEEVTAAIDEMERILAMADERWARIGDENRMRLTGDLGRLAGLVWRWNDAHPDYPLTWKRTED